MKTEMKNRAPARSEGAVDRLPWWQSETFLARLGRFRLLALLWFIFMASSLLSRTVLSAVAMHEGLVTFSLLPLAWLGGLLLDALAGLYFCLPLAVYLWLMPERAYRSTFGRVLVQIGFFVTIAALIYLIAAEYFFFDEFNARFNYTAVEYLIYPTEVFGNIRDSYPVYPVMAAAVIAALLLVFALRRHLVRVGEPAQGFAQRSAIVGVLALVVAASLWLVSLETVQGISSNRIADEIAANGVYSFFSALRNAKIDYERYYPTVPEDEAIARVRKMLTQSNTKYLGPPETKQSPLARQVDNSDLGPPRKLNVIILFQESMGSEFISSLGGRDLTPNIDRIAAESLSFTNLYASGTRTVRGMEALTTSLAPVPPEAIV
ncbi:MAG: sulfatase-like hydrolase/transferase, partial [Dokdonella sp.]